MSHGDGAMAVRLLGKDGKYQYLVITKYETIKAPTLRGALSIQEINSGNLVSIHYIVDARGDIIGKIETPLSKLLDEHLYPSSSDMARWLEHPESIPEGVSMRIFIGNIGKELILTNRSKNFYRELTIENSTLYGVELSTLKVTV